MTAPTGPLTKADDPSVCVGEAKACGLCANCTIPLVIPSRRQAHPLTENELKGIILKMAHARGWQVFHMVADTIRGSQGKGYPDLTLARDGEVLWLELKQEGGKLSDAQAGWQLALPRMEVIRPSDLARGRVDELLA